VFLSYKLGTTYPSFANEGQRGVILNDIAFNKQLGNLTGRCFEMPYVSYCHPLALIKITLIIFFNYGQMSYIYRQMAQS